MDGVTESNALRQYHNQVIFSHKHLATILSDVASTVVDGRIPGYDLPKLLSGLAAREVVMAKNWTPARDGLLSRVIDNPALLTIGAIPEAEEAGMYAALSRSYGAISIDEEEQQVSSEMEVQEDPRHATLPETRQVSEILPIAERKRLNKEFRGAQRAYRAAIVSNDVQEQLSLEQYLDDIESKLQKNNRLRRLEANKSYTDGPNAVKVTAAQQVANSALTRIARQKAQEKEERRAGKDAEQAEHVRRKARREAARKAQHEKRMQEQTKKKERRRVEHEARMERQQRAKEARLEAWQKTTGGAASLPTPQRPLPPLSHDATNFTIKQEVTEP